MAVKDYLYYQDDWATIYCGDCLEVMPLIENKIDLVLTDPPYDKYTHNGALTGSEKKFGIEFDALSNPTKVLNMFIAVSCSWIVIFCSLEMLGLFQSLVPNNYVRGGIWDRIVNSPQMSGDRPAQACEGIAILHSQRKNMKWNGGGKAALWRYMVERNEKLHPTQKPLFLLKDLIRLFSNENQMLLDPFLGSGTTCVAAKNLNRKSIGIEINPDYCEIAVKRLRQEVFDFRK